MRVKLLLLGLLLLGGLGIQGNYLAASFLLASTNDPPCTPKARENIGLLQIAFIDCRSNEDEVVIILNGSNENLDLTHYRITNSRNQEFEFVQTIWNQGCCTIKAHDLFRIHSGNATFFNDLRDLHWLKENAEPYRDTIWNDDGDKAQLWDAQGQLPLDTYAYGKAQE